MAATTIYLIRHAHADWRDDDARPLSPSGLDAARLVADVLASRPIVAALVLNGLDSAFGYDFWRRLSFPDVYRLALEDHALVGVERSGVVRPRSHWA